MTRQRRSQPSSLRLIAYYSKREVSNWQRLSISVSLWLNRQTSTRSIHLPTASSLQLRREQGPCQLISSKLFRLYTKRPSLSISTISRPTLTLAACTCSTTGRWTPHWQPSKSACIRTTKVRPQSSSVCSSRRATTTSVSSSTNKPRRSRLAHSTRKRWRHVNLTLKAIWSNQPLTRKLQPIMLLRARSYKGVKRL